ncbi:carboxyl-terminal-processing peptidase 1, chloroplastic-like [Coffea eugenioides]|uniref:carboxyl-terminal-processing peptidase 1, chloroplastic-like n=1 Tax=Coffea eugenioides TaxID=49369 RepID=UPI000F609326|nr:carboxyl-terminal-processing peptidase 1, chloroplastic-like [Coffea eugenioides]
MPHRSCECRHTYGYPDEVVLAVDDERRYLGKAVDRLVRQLEEAREISHGQARSIRDLEQSLRVEVERTDTLHRQLHDTHQHLFTLKGQLRERARGIMLDCEVLLDMAAEAPPRATDPELMDEVDTLGSGDELLSVNGVDIRGKSAFEASSLLQGPGETFVDITVKHGNCGPVQALEVQRQSVAKTPVFYRLEQSENGTTSVGYVHLKEFNALARKDLVIAIKRLEDTGAQYFVLDLRDNLGGLVQAGIEIAKLFLNKGETVTYTVGRDPEYVKNIVAEVPPLVSAPVIVFVNKNTASASEIVATALHDNCRAVLVGERTYGKGLIQSVFELHDGSGVVVTVGKYVTPNHMDINGNGVEPDFRSLPSWDEVMNNLSKCHKPPEG